MFTAQCFEWFGAVFKFSQSIGVVKVCWYIDPSLRCVVKRIVDGSYSNIEIHELCAGMVWIP
jgi:hypothetical protein